MKRSSLIVAVPAALSLLTGASLIRADDTLLTPPERVEEDRHITWHEFRHELGAYPQARSEMDRDGVVWIRGHVDTAIERNRLGRLARQIRGATEIRNQLRTD